MDDQPAVTGSQRIATSFRVFPWVVLAMLALAAVSYQGYQAWIALDRDDTNHLETPLAMATARQFAEGPSTLYGPFSGKRPEVLIHAPLYYRLVAILGWPFVRAGGDPLLVSLYAGRAFSAVGLLMVLFTSWRIAQIGGRQIGGPIAALLVASSPVFGSFGFTVRPDTLALGLQTLGFGLAWKVLSRTTRFPTGTALLCGLVFGLAVCMKQHLVVAASVVGLLMMVFAARGVIAKRSLLVMVGTGFMVVGGYFSLEQYLTGGWMFQSVFQLPARLRELAPASWSHVRMVFLEVAKRGIGELGLVVALTIAGGPRVWRGTRLDATLALVFLAEVLAMIPLCLASEGAFVNYAMPAVVWGSILLARALGRYFSRGIYGWRSLLVILALAFLIARSVHLVIVAQTIRHEDHLVMAELLRDPLVASVQPESRYFVSRPQHNRRYGAADLAHDEWLYGSFEQAEVAEPRSMWLREKLSGPSATVRLVIVPSDEPTGSDSVRGISASLPELGYRHVQQYEQYGVWTRDP